MSNPQRPEPKDRQVCSLDSDYIYDKREIDTYMDHLQEMRDLWKQSEADCAKENRRLEAERDRLDEALTGPDGVDLRDTAKRLEAEVLRAGAAIDKAAMKRIEELEAENRELRRADTSWQYTDIGKLKARLTEAERLLDVLAETLKAMKPTHPSHPYEKLPAPWIPVVQSVDDFLNGVSAKTEGG